MTNRQRIEAVFHGEEVDSVPFCLKGWRIPQCTLEGELRAKGMAILDSAGVHSGWRPNCRSTTTVAYENGVQYSRAVIDTPRGTLTRVMASDPSAPRSESTAWYHEHLFKSAADYDAIEAWIRDEEVRPNYEGYLRAAAYIGEEAAFKTAVPAAGIHLLMYTIMGVQTFSMELMDNEDSVRRLIRALDERNRKIYEVAAKSPAEIIQVGGNYSPDVLGRARFNEFIAPHWREVCDLLHEEHKLVGCHLDANNKLWSRDVGASGLDWIEAFSPAPDTDMSVADARRDWPGKVLFINFPSSVHLQEPEEIRAATRGLLREAAPGDRFIVGITENVPDHRWPISFPIILDECRTSGRIPIRA